MKTPPLKQDPRTGTYYVNVPTASGSKRVTTRCTSEADAKRVVSQSNVKEMIIEARAGRLSNRAFAKILSGGKHVTLARAVAEWQEWSRSVGNSEFSTRHMGGQMEEWMRMSKTGHLSPALITERHINGWVNPKASESKASTRAAKLASVRSLFRFCVAKGYCIGDPSQLVRVNYAMMSHSQKEKRPRQIFADDEVRLLLSECQRRRAETEKHYSQEDANNALFWESAIAIARWTGLRMGDICQLEWSCLDNPGSLSVWTDKRDRRVQLPLKPKELAQAIAAIPRRHKQFLFPEQRIITTTPTKRALLSTQFSRMCRAVGINGKCFHDLRSTYASACLRDGVPMPHISQSLGHVYPTTTQGYIAV